MELSLQLTLNLRVSHSGADFAEFKAKDKGVEQN
jgi:hypothetical protein